MTTTLEPPDLLDLLTADTFTNPAHERIKAECLRAIQAVFDRDGTVDRNRARDERADWAKHDNRAGQTMSALVKAGVAVPTGEFALSGDSDNRASMQPCKKYRLTRPVWPEPSN